MDEKGGSWRIIRFEPVIDEYLNLKEYFMNLKHQSLTLLLFMCLTLYFTGCKTLTVEVNLSKGGEKNKQEEGTDKQNEQTATSTAVAAATAAATAAAITTTATTATSTSTATTTATETTAATTTQLQQSPPPPPPTSAGARFIPVTLELVNRIQDSEADLNDLRYYLSKPFAMTIAVQKNTPERMVVNEGMLIISGGQEITTREEEFAIDNQGRLRNRTSLEILEIDFKGISLTFKWNSPQGRYDLYSTMVDARPHIFHEDELPYLCILAELNERNEVLVDSTTDGIQRNAGRDQLPVRGREQSHQQNRTSPASRSMQIIGRGSVTKAGITAYVISQNRSVNSATLATLSRLIDKYFEEARIEGINFDIAIAQMLYATNYLRIRMATHNYAGFSINGSRLNGRPWNGSFSDMRTGIRAHIQHLKGYASRAPLNRTLIDPRYHILAEMGYLGQKNTFDQVFRAWSQNPNYGNEINRILNDLYRFSGNS